MALLLLAAMTAQAPATLEALILAEDRRASGPGDYELLATTAGSHENAIMRARAVRALGRLEQRHPRGASPADLIERALGDPDSHVRRTAAYALAQSVIASDAAAKASRRARLLAVLALEDEDVVAGALMESAARLADTASVGEVETAVLAQLRSAYPDAIASALEILARRAGKPGLLSASAFDWLRAAVLDPSLGPDARRAALQALVTQRAADAAFATRAFSTDDWQLRRLAVLAVAGSPGDAGVIELALRDPDAHVRYEAVRVTARRGETACPALINAVKDADPHVALAAIDLLARCGDPSSGSILESLAASPGGINWHRASHALVSLAARDRGRTRELLPPQARDSAWPVRMYAAAAAARAGDDETLVQLSADAHPNVREAAIAGLVERVKDPTDPAAARARLTKAVLSALGERRDPQLLRTAAGAVPATGDAPAFRAALLEALDALDAGRGETTRDARAAIVEALKLAAPGEAPPAPPRPLAPMTPSMQELQRLPARARIHMARGGVIELELLPDEAPATVARFARLADAGYFNGLTFHRVVPNFVVQGGSPWANEYAGALRFQRDELGFARHERGAVGISTRGRDTGDAQIFIDLVDLPRLNHDYTVFARVVSGMDVVDAVVEADLIQRITILK
ncbi:MAG: peptidylprolyl isomerase [Vicinamibacterales bacterium]